MSPTAAEKAFHVAVAFLHEGYYSAAGGFLRQIPPGHFRYAEAQAFLDQIPIPPGAAGAPP